MGLKNLIQVNCIPSAQTGMHPHSFSKSIQPTIQMRLLIINFFERRSLYESQGRYNWFWVDICNNNWLDTIQLHIFWVACATLYVGKHIYLTHWGRVLYICVGYLAIIGSDNGLSPVQHQAISWINAGLSLVGTVGTHFSEVLIEIITFSFM